MLKRILFICLLLTAFCSLPSASAQTVTIRRGSTVPASCDVLGVTSSPIFWKITGNSVSQPGLAGLYTCIAGVYVYQTNTFGSGLVAKTMLYASAAPVAITSTAAPTNGQLLIGSTGLIPALGTLTGTANEVVITNGAGSITLSLASAVARRTVANTNTNVAAPSTPAAGFTSTWADSTDKTLKAIDDAGVISTTAKPLTAVKGVVFTGMSSAGVFTTNSAEVLLNTTASVDMNTATASTLFSCPGGRSCVITRVVVRNASTSLTTASYSFGWTSATFLDVIANATHTELTGSTLYTAINAKVGALVGTAGQDFKVLMNTLQGGAATTTIDVFGYTF